jgi:hypothetical protein
MIQSFVSRLIELENLCSATLIFLFSVTSGEAKGEHFSSHDGSQSTSTAPFALQNCHSGTSRLRANPYPSPNFRAAKEV